MEPVVAYPNVPSSMQWLSNSVQHEVLYYLFIYLFNSAHMLVHKIVFSV